MIGFILPNEGLFPRSGGDDPMIGFVLPNEGIVSPLRRGWTGRHCLHCHGVRLCSDSERSVFPASAVMILGVSMFFRFKSGFSVVYYYRCARFFGAFR